MSAIRAAIWWSLASTAVVGFALIVAITVSVIRPLGALGRSTAAITSGDLTQALDLRWRDEVGRMTAALESMKRLKHLESREMLYWLRVAAKCFHRTIRASRIDKNRPIRPVGRGRSSSGFWWPEQAV